MKNSEVAEQKWIEGCDLEDRGKYTEAVKVYLIAAQMGHIRAMSNLGNLLDDKIKPPRPDEAVYWYKRAARRGSSTAAWNLAIHYKNRDQHRWYMHWLKAAAGLGDSEAVSALRETLKLV